jgi:large subunit ribosomal protein L29
MAKSAPLTEMADSELYERLAENKKELFNLRFQLATGQLDNSARLNQVKKDVARCLTELRVREIAAYEAQAQNTEES